ncbi:tRNA-dihydrouridine(20a/20b) synthase [NAD(P)+]-like isoform X2 [Macrobrachium rosenbergii]|uniref:tRNA-dihydrouridine(20a/20b) synthase [NAD(P)+]-like isoform X2 n=1 Tax=Macrobrachium rosenbergii TaxID=79674 RepID=UPI0034D6BBD9
MEEGSYLKPLELFRNKELVTVCAPMVRYSKLAFRSLVRKYGCDLCFTPMIISNSFIQSVRARHSDFTTCKEDRPLIVQFAANNSEELADASRLVAPYCDGVDLNCGCPQRWAMAEGYGACLIHKPELVADMIRQTRNLVTDPDFTVSIKIRIHEDYRKTVEFARQMEAAGVSFITVHGRTQEQRTEPVCLEAIREIKSAVNIPVVANGDVRTMEDALRIQEGTGVNVTDFSRGMEEGDYCTCSGRTMALYFHPSPSRIHIWPNTPKAVESRNSHFNSLGGPQECNSFKGEQRLRYQNREKLPSCHPIIISRARLTVRIFFNS